MQKAVEIQNRSLTLRGMLHIPDGFSGKIPVVAIFHGFTGNKMEPHFIFVKLSRILEKRGIASVRFDFGGSGESDGDFSEMTITKELDDAKAILNYIQSLEFTDPNRIGIVGLSMGGAVASMLAGERKDEVQALCLWAPAGNMKELTLQRIQAYGPEIYEKNGYADVGGLLIGREFVDEISTLDIYKKATPYHKPVLIIHGRNDQSVPVYVSQKYLELYGQYAKLNIIEDADHTFNSIAWEKEVIDLSSEFLMKELLR